MRCILLVNDGFLRNYDALWSLETITGQFRLAALKTGIFVTYTNGRTPENVD